MTRLKNGSGRWLAVLSIGAIVAVAPVAPGASLIPGFAKAFAAAGGNGGGNGADNGGGNAGGNGGGNANGGGNNGGGNGGGNAGGNASGGGNAGGSGHNGGASGHSNGTTSGMNASGMNGHNAGPGQAGRGAISSAAGALNAAHASPQALANAAPGSRVGQVAAYDRAMLAALSMPGTTPAQLASRMSSISAARGQLATASGKSLTPAVVARVDSLLGLPSTDPALGVR